MPLLPRAAANRFFVLIGGGGVDVPVPGLQRLGDHLFGLVGGYLVDAEPEDRDLDAVVQRDGLHGLLLPGCGIDGLASIIIDGAVLQIALCPNNFRNPQGYAWTRR